MRRRKERPEKSKLIRKKKQKRNGDALVTINEISNESEGSDSGGERNGHENEHIPSQPSQIDSSNTINNGGPYIGVESSDAMTVRSST